MGKTDVIVIGSGLGGLLCAALLSREGLGVRVLEQQPVAGGNLQTFIRRGREFETGMHYAGSLGPGQPLKRYWDYLGITKDLELKQLDPDGYDRILFGDAEYPVAQGADNLRARLEPYFPGAGQQLRKYVNDLEEITRSFALYNLEMPGEDRESAYRSLSAVEFLGKINATDPRNGNSLSSVLAGNNFLYGGSSDAPLHMHALISHSFLSGAYRIVGGSRQLAERLVSTIQAAGGEVYTGRQVNRLEKLSKGFRLETQNGEIFESDRVVAAIHPVSLIKMMPAGSFRPAFTSRIGSLPASPAPFALFLSMKPGTFPYLNANYYSHLTGSPWDQSEIREKTWPSMYMLSTPCSSADQQHAGTVIVLTYLHFDEVRPWESTLTGRRGPGYREFKEEKAERLIKAVARRFPEIRQGILHVETATPLTWRDYTGTPFGSMYGIRKDWQNPDNSVVHPRTRIPGLFFTGQNVNLHGALGVTVGSVLTCSEILGLNYLLKKIRDGKES